MPQATEELRKAWGGEQGIGEDKAGEFLEKNGWHHWHNGLWCPNKSTTKISKDEWDAVQFLIDEWDHAFEFCGKHRHD